MSETQVLGLLEHAQAVAFGPRLYLVPPQNRIAAIHIIRNMCVHRGKLLESENARSALADLFDSALGELATSLSLHSSRVLEDAAGATSTVRDLGIDAGDGEHRHNKSTLVPFNVVLVNHDLMGFVRSLLAHDVSHGRMFQRVLAVWENTPSVLKSLENDFARNDFSASSLRSDLLSQMQQLVAVFEVLGHHDLPLAIGSVCTVVTAGQLERVGHIVGTSDGKFGVVVNGWLEEVRWNQIKWTPSGDFDCTESNGQADVVESAVIGFGLPPLLQKAARSASMKVLGSWPDKELPTTTKRGALAILHARLQCLAMLNLRSGLAVVPCGRTNREMRNATVGCILKWVRVHAANRYGWRQTQTRLQYERHFERVLESPHPCSQSEARKDNRMQPEQEVHRLFFPTATAVLVEVHPSTAIDVAGGAALQIWPHCFKTMELSSCSQSLVDDTGAAARLKDYRTLLEGVNQVTLVYQPPKDGSNVSDMWGWRVRCCPIFQLPMSPSVSIPEPEDLILHISNSLTSKPLTPSHRSKSWKCKAASDLAACQKKSSASTYTGICWSDGSLDFCHTCALWLSQERRVVTHDGALQPTYKKTSTW